MEKTIYTTSSSAEREAAMHCIDVLADDAELIWVLYRYAENVRNSRNSRLDSILQR